MVSGGGILLSTAGFFGAEEFYATVTVAIAEKPFGVAIMSLPEPAPPGTSVTMSVLSSTNWTFAAGISSGLAAPCLVQGAMLSGWKAGAPDGYNHLGIARLDGLHAGRAGVADRIDSRWSDGEADLVLTFAVHEAEHVLARAQVQLGRLQVDRDSELRAERGIRGVRLRRGP